MTRTRLLSRILGHLQVVVMTVGVATPGIQFACGPGDSTPSEPTPPRAGRQNPCPATPSPAAFGAGLGTVAPFGGGHRKTGPVHGHAPRTVVDAVWEHRIGLDRGLVQPVPRRAVTEDAGEIAVLQDEGDLILAANLYDLRDVTLRFEPNAGGGYDVARVGPATYRASLGDQVMLGDDDTAPLALPFEFPYYGQVHRGAFVNSDGNLTFEEGDAASTSRSISRLLTGPPRIAPFLADLDPSAGGAVFAGAGAGALTVTWCAVPEFDSPTSTATVQVSLLPNGHVEMTFGRNIAVSQAVVGLSPGRTDVFEAVDLSAAGSLRGGRGAVGERFSQRSELDLVAVGTRFAAAHPDAYDQLVIWLDRPVRADEVFAYEVGVANDVRGIGLPLYDLSADLREREAGERRGHGVARQVLGRPVVEGDRGGHHAGHAGPRVGAPVAGAP